MEEGLPHFGILGTLGTMGLGLVWGWLIGSLMRRVHRPWKTILSVLLATMVVSAQVLWLMDSARLLYFYGATLIGWVIHIELHRNIRQSLINSNL